MNIRRFVSLPPLRQPSASCKMLALSSLVLTTMLFSTPPAHAAHWRFSAAGTTFTPTVRGNKSGTPSTLTVPLDANDAMAVNFPGVTAADEQTVGSPSCSCTLNASVKITATWTHEDLNAQNDTNDPAPTKVWIVEKSGASWSGGTNGAQPAGDDGGPPPPSPFTCSGNASDGVAGDQQYYTAFPVGRPTAGSVTTPAAQGTAPPAPPGWSTQNVNGKTFTLTRTLSANGTATFTTPCMVSMTCGLGSYSISIHAQPYNFQRAPYFDPSGGLHDVGYDSHGQLHFHYIWSSTDGNVNHLTSCVIL